MLDTVKIVVDGTPPSNNKYMGNSRNFNIYRRDKEEWEWRIKAKAHQIPKKPFKKATVTITYYFKTRHRRDPDNFSGKLLIDPLVRVGILEDDSFNNIVALRLAANYDKHNPRTEITVQRYKGGANHDQ